MHKYLPSKKFLYTFGAIILATLIVLGVGILGDRQKTKSQNKVADTQAARETAQKFMVIDTDSDGLKDWEETLWKTDPQKADTDGDSSSDGEEVKANRNPLKPGPNDEIDPQLIADQKKEETDFLELTQTEQISRILFSQYLAAKGSGALSEADKEVILNSAISMIDGDTVIKYSLSDLKITNDTSTTSVKAYGNALGQTFFTGTSVAKVENELVVIDRAVKNGSAAALNGLDPVIESYGKTISKMAMVTVPSNVVYQHLAILNDLLTIKTSLEKIKNMFTDPAQAIGGMKGYQLSSANLAVDMFQLRDYFITKGVTYTNTEYGYIFISVL